MVRLAHGSVGCSATGGQVIKTTLYKSVWGMGPIAREDSIPFSGYFSRNGQVVYRSSTRSPSTTYNTPWIGVNPGDRLQMVQTGITVIPYV